MPTVSSMTRQSDMVAQLSHKLFKLDMAAANDSVLVGASIKVGANFLQSEFGGQPGLTTIVENYTAEKSNFGADLKSAISNLQKSADNLKNSVQSESVESVPAKETETNTDTGSNVSSAKVTEKNTVSVQEKNNSSQTDLKTQNNSAVRQQHEKVQHDYFKEFAENYLVADKNQNSSENEETQTDNQDEKLNAVQNFVKDYNNATKYLTENSLSKNEDLKNSLNKIGISVSSSGELSLDKETLTNAIQNDSENVESILGSNGLAGQLDKDVERVNRQGENLFPSIVDYANQKNSNRSESLYSAKNMATAAYSNIVAGHLLNTFT